MALIGISVAVPDPDGARLQDYRRELGDPDAALIPTHVTLVPPVEVDDAAVPVICEHLHEVAAAHPPFGIHLRGTGTFRPISPVVFVNLVEGISACELLAESVRRGPLATELDFPYHPHVTVAHDLPDGVLDRAFEELADFETRFEVEAFWLYRFSAAAGWVRDEGFDLASAPRASGS